MSQHVEDRMCEGKERQRLYEEYRKDLLAWQLSNAQNFDKAGNQGSGGASDSSGGGKKP